MNIFRASRTIIANWRSVLSSFATTINNGKHVLGRKDVVQREEKASKALQQICLFCRPRVANKKFFRSSQNAALLQYRIPFRGSFIAHVRFHKITQRKCKPNVICS